jgi:hypothetical protein
MGFNRRKMEDRRRDGANKEAATRRATDAQVLEDAERLIAAWNERQAKRMPMLFSPTIGAAITAGHWFGCAARLAERSTQSTCVGLTVTPTQRLAVSFPRCRVDHAGRMHRLPSLCGFHERASPMKCGKNIVAAC